MVDVATSERLFAGDRIGNYKVEIERASGPMLAEYQAVHIVLPRRAVIKVMNATTDQPLAVHMLREACILDALHHPGIVRVYESGIHSRRPWFALELIEGPTIRNLLAPGAIERPDAVALLRDLAEVIEHASRRGIIHCGLRPERILITGRTRGFSLCITDWSDARTHDAKLQQFVPSEAARHYTSPELAFGDPIDDRTDVFALGVLAYQLLTGSLPFENGIIETVDDGTAQHIPTEVMCPDAPPELPKLVDTMLAYDRWDRPSAAEVFAELSWIADAFAMPAARPAGMQLFRIRRPRWTPPIVTPPKLDRARTENDLEKSEDSD
jgi:serine/threonine-protein kinase